MKKIPGGFAVIPSAAFAITSNIVKRYATVPDRIPQVGDLVYGTVVNVGQHQTLENRNGRLHILNNGSKAVFVFGNRYAPDYYEAFVPTEPVTIVDMIARSGVIGQVKCKNGMIKDPTRIKINGYLVDQFGGVYNTTRFKRVLAKATVKKEKRAKLVLSVGTSMNSGKSMSAAACCWALSGMGYGVRAAKITGTASLKDILLMEDHGAQHIADFTYLGYPSTYMLSIEQLIGIFNVLDLKYANNSSNYWVVEIADGILQRETRMLLQHSEVRSRIHTLIFSAQDAFGAIGGLGILKNEFNLVPDAISGIVSSSPLGLQELYAYTDIPVLNNLERTNITAFADVICKKDIV